MNFIKILYNYKMNVSNIQNINKTKKANHEIIRYLEDYIDFLNDENIKLINEIKKQNFLINNLINEVKFLKESK